MGKTQPIPKAAMKAAVRTLRRRFAAALIGAMAETDTSFTEIASRLGGREKTVRRWLMRMADGRKADRGDCLKVIADIATACGCRVEFKLMPREDLQPLSSSDGADQ